MPVRIVNGEIVRDDGQPRQRAAGGAASSSGTGNRFATLETMRQSEASSRPGGSAGAGRGSAAQPAASAGGGGGQGEDGSILTKAAIQLGVHGKFVEVPAIPALNWRPTQIPLIYVVVAGVLVLLAVMRGWSLPRVAIGLALVAGFYIHAQQTAAVPAVRHGAAAAHGAAAGPGSR